MPKILFIILIVNSLLFAQSPPEILSLKVYPKNNQTGFPYIYNEENSRNQITIEFDVNAELIPDLMIKFFFCDKDWNISESIFLENSGYNIEYSLWLDKLPQHVATAQYHYKDFFPNENVTLPFAGNWIFQVINKDDDNILTEGRFYVVTNNIPLNYKLKNSTLQRFQKSNEYSRTKSLNVGFVLPDSMISSRVEQVRVVKNFLIDYPLVITQDDNSDERSFEWNGSNKYNFIVNDIKPGNEYRKLDMRSTTKFYTGRINYKRDGADESRFYRHSLQQDLNGASRLLNFNDTYAEYLITKLELIVPEENRRDIFIVGSFNDWEVLPEYQLKQKDLRASIGLELKRGIYDYQYVLGTIKNNKVIDIDWLTLEGNYWETSNNLFVFLYYNTTELGGYDKIIGFVEIKSGSKK